MVWVAGDADGEGVAGDAPGDVLGEGGVGRAGGGNGVGAAVDGLVDGVSCDALVARVLLMMVPGVSPHHPWWGVWWVEVVCWFIGLGSDGCLWCRRLLLVTLMVGVLLVIVLLMPLAWLV